MSTIKSDNSDLTINASGTSKDIKFQADGTEKMVLKSDGKLGVGVTPDRELTVGGVSNARINILSNASSLGASQLMFGDPADSQVGRVYYDHDDNSMRFHTNASERLRITSAGNVGIGTSSPTSNIHIGATGADDKNEFRIDGTNGSSDTFGFILESDGENSRVVFKTGHSGATPTQRLMIHPDGGITFNGDTAAANALDDYEEGSWTPTLANGTIGPASGRYTKIGNTVHATWTLKDFTNKSTTNPITIRSLPFAQIATGVNAGTVVAYQNGQSTPLNIVTGANVNEFHMYYMHNASSWGQQQHDTLGSDPHFYCVATYKTS
jgi:hypothetical protein